MDIIRPRLNDFYNLSLTQQEVDFAIPFLEEDIPLYVDPFLLWKSPSQQDNGLHVLLIDTFNRLGNLYLEDKNKAINILKKVSECNEVGLGESKTKQGLSISNEFADKILSTFKDIPQINQHGFFHLEEVQLLIEGFSKDRISDISCNFIKSFLTDYTIQQTETYNIPKVKTKISLLDYKKAEFIEESLELPINPNSKTPILLVPKRWLRFVPWINFDNYYKDYISTTDKLLSGKPIDRIKILEFNRKNYDQVQSYIKRKQLSQNDCRNDPLFTQIPILSSKRKLSSILSLSTGKTNNADKEYENNLCQFLASALYPELDFAQAQSRTVSGVLIRDLIFYNNTSHPLLKELSEDYASRQLVFELKNVKELNNDHIDQLNRYLNNQFGRFGIIFTRNKPPQKVFKNTIDLWSGQRKCILILDDEDLKLMAQIYEDKQRKPIDVINKKFREFISSCPS